MAESFNLLRRVKSLDISPEQPAYSGVVIFAGQDEEGNNIEYSAGDRTGTVLETTNEWGSQAQADAIYQKILGFKYQPYRATGSQIDPSTEIGDAVTVADIHGGVFSKRTTFGRHIRTDLEAPSREEVEHEYQITSPSNRQYQRAILEFRSGLSLNATSIAAEVSERKNEYEQLRASIRVTADAISTEVSERKNEYEQLRASIRVTADAISTEVSERQSDISSVQSILTQQAGQISAKVSQNSGDYATFGWNLMPTFWEVASNYRRIFYVDENGAEVYGKLTATSGRIGGFDIQSNYLSYNGHTWGGTNTTGAYIGQSGIQLGKNFRVDMQGNLTASSGTFSGFVRAGSIQYGDDNGYFSGSGISAGSVHGGSGGAIAGGSLSTFNMTGGINTSLGYADYANGVFHGWNTVNLLRCSTLSCSSAVLSNLTVGNFEYVYKVKSFIDGNGNNVMIEYLGRKS